jgi:hypothetical protein
VNDTAKSNNGATFLCSHIGRDLTPCAMGLFYSEAFGKDVKPLFDDVANGYIFALSAYRNALTHNAGRADKHFVKRVERFPELRAIAPNDRLLLDGELVKKLRRAAIFLGTKLTLFVDDILTPPTTQPSQT